MIAQVEVDPALLASVVREEIDRRAVRGEGDLAEAFSLAASQAYQSAQRLREFGKVDARFFESLGFGKLLVDAVSRAPGVSSRASAVRFVPTASSASETIDLVDPQRMIVACRLRPGRFASPADLSGWLDHELGHAEDLLDPEFGFDGTRARQELPDSLVARRYRALWCASVDGRLARRMGGGEPVRPLRDIPAHARSLGATLAIAAEDALSRARALFMGPAARHAELLREAAAIRCRCPLCRFPVYPECSPLAGVPEAAVARVREIAPAWDPADGMCDRCREYFGLELRTLARSPG